MIKVFTFCFNNPDFLEKQYLTFKEYLHEEHQLHCINNARELEDKNAVFEKCNLLKIPCWLPSNVNHDQAGWSHQTALNWAWHNLIAKHDDTAIIVDHDMFPIKEFNLYKEYDIASLMQGRGNNIKYFHSAIMIINPSLIDRDTVDFMGEEIDGYRCDTGGNWHHYMQAHPNLKIKEMSISYIPSEDFKENELEVIDDFLLHFRGGSNWMNMPKDMFQRKVNELNKILGL